MTNANIALTDLAEEGGRMPTLSNKDCNLRYSDL
jgi:hypothetical protein